MLADTHAHLDFVPQKQTVEDWLGRAKAAGVGKIICVGTSVEASKTCAEIAQKYSSDDLQIYATVGIHAQDGREDVEKYGSIDKCADQLRKILDQVENDRVIVGIGECGYDFKTERDTSTELSASRLPETRRFQKQLFEAQIKLAAELKLPLVVHCRNAWEETFTLIENLKSLVRFREVKNESLSGVFHSWTGDWEAAQKALSMGFYISFSGIVTFKNAPNVQEVAKKMPLDKMLLETDSPFLSPEPMRGAQNEPKNVRIVAEFIAGLRNVSLDEIADGTSENAGRLFNI